MTDSPRRKARKTIYRGIEMRSRLEAGYAAWLDKRGWEWEYEPCAFGSGEGQYLPDFRIEGVRSLHLRRESHAYVEVKPSYAGLDHDQLARRMAVIWESEPEALLLLQAPPPHELLKVPTGRSGLTGVGAVLEASAHVWMLLRTPEPCWSVAAWIACEAPMIGWPLPVEHGPWAGDYWNVA